MSLVSKIKDLKWEVVCPLKNTTAPKDNVEYLNEDRKLLIFSAKP